MEGNLKKKKKKKNPCIFGFFFQWMERLSSDTVSHVFFVHFWSNFTYFPYPLFLLMFTFSFYVFIFYVSSHSQTDDKNTIQLVQLVTDMIYLATDIPKQSCFSSLTQSCTGTLSATLVCSTVQSSRLPRYGAWVGVHPLHEDFGWLQGSLLVLQQDLPDWLPLFDEPCPLILQGTC